MYDTRQQRRGKGGPEQAAGAGGLFFSQLLVGSDPHFYCFFLAGFLRGLSTGSHLIPSRISGEPRRCRGTPMEHSLPWERKGGPRHPLVSRTKCLGSYGTHGNSNGNPWYICAIECLGKPWVPTGIHAPLPRGPTGTLRWTCPWDHTASSIRSHVWTSRADHDL